MLPSLIRIWEAVRAHHMDTWLAEQDLAWDWCAAGRAAEDAAWETLLRQEAVGEEGKRPTIDANVEVMVTCVMDLVKTFEKTALAVVWKSGIYYGFPLRVLRNVST